MRLPPPPMPMPETFDPSGSQRPPRSAEDGAFAPTPHELERLLFAFESALQINKRFQFFLWAQGVLQSFLPHQVLICGFGNLDADTVDIDVFSSDLVADPEHDEERESVNACFAAALREWNRKGREPLLLSTDQQAARPDHPLTHAIWELGLGHTIAHGTREIHGANGSFFVFGRCARDPRRRSRDILEILLPYLHFAVHRYGLGAAADGGAAAGVGCDLSEREIQIMSGVRDGKTNAEIGAELSISPLTVKNHVQRILRKLGVANRAQAVARCLSANVFAGMR